MIRFYGDQSRKKEIIQTSRWLAEEILGPKISKEISLSIILQDMFEEGAFRKDKRIWGSCLHVSGNKFRFELSSFLNNTPIKTCATLAHEMTHIRQYLTGDLYFYPSISFIRWKGRRYSADIENASNRDEYYKIPWEKEAMDAEEVFRKRYSQLHR